MRRAMVVILSALVLTSVSPIAPAADNKVRIGFQPGTSPRFFVARDHGMFKKVGLTAEYVQFIAGPPMLSALETGTIDMAFMTTAPAIFGLAQGIDYRVFFVEADASQSVALVSTKRAGIKTLAEQRGKRIGVQFGTSAHYALLRSLEAAKLKETDLKILDMQASVIVPAFLKGNIDGGWAWDPWVARMQAEGGSMVWALSDQRLPMPLVWVVRTAWLNSNRDTVQLFIKAMELSHAYLMENPKEGIASLGQVFGVNEELAKQIYNRIEVPSIKEQVTGYVGALGTSSTKATSGMATHMSDLASFFFALKRIPVKPDVIRAIDPGPLEAYTAKKR